MMKSTGFPVWLQVEHTNLYQLNKSNRNGYYLSFVIANHGFYKLRYSFSSDEILFKTYCQFELLDYINNNTHIIANSDVMIQYILFNEILSNSDV